MTPTQLKSARKRLGLSQPALAKLLGVTRDSIAKWESGRVPIDTRTALAVEHLFCGHA